MILLPHEKPCLVSHGSIGDALQPLKENKLWCCLKFCVPFHVSLCIPGLSVAGLRQRSHCFFCLNVM